MRNPGDEPVFTDTLALDMSTVEASLAGPKRPQDRVLLSQVPKTEPYRVCRKLFI